MNDPRTDTSLFAAGATVAGLTPGDESPGHFGLTARTRAGRIAQILRYLARWGARAEPSWQQRLTQLRLARGRFARKARRARIHGIGKTVRALRGGKRPSPATRPRGSDRLPHADRMLLLQQEGRPISGRQWRKLRKAARRQERAS